MAKPTELENKLQIALERLFIEKEKAARVCCVGGKSNSSNIVVALEQQVRELETKLNVGSHSVNTIT